MRARTLRSTPARLRGLVVALVVLCLLTALASVLSGRSQGDAVGEGGARLAALDYDTAELYESLNGADASATAIAAAGTGSQTAQARYDSYVTSAYLRLDHARSLLSSDEPDAALAESIAFQLLRYTATADDARAKHDVDPQTSAREFSSAAGLMNLIRPSADALQRHQRDALAADYGRAGGFPVTLAVAGLVTLLALAWASVREAVRTKRVVNLGLLGAGILTVLTLAWWLVAVLGAAGQLQAVRDHNAAATQLGQVRIAMLQARAVETASPPAADRAQELASAFAGVLAPHGALDTGQSPPASAATVRLAITTWQSAVDAPGGDSGEPSRIAFVGVTTALGDAVDDEQGRRTAAIGSSGAFLGSLAYGPGVLMVLAAVLAFLGVRVRLREYRR